jgi:hypothetical protein
MLAPCVNPRALSIVVLVRQHCGLDTCLRDGCGGVQCVCVCVCAGGGDLALLGGCPKFSFHSLVLTCVCVCKTKSWGYRYQGFDSSTANARATGSAPAGSHQLSVLGYSCESGDQALWDPRTFPYSSAVVNTCVFLLLCLVTQMSVLSARVDGWFFTRRPGYVLLSIISVEMICTTITAAFMRAYPFW